MRLRCKEGGSGEHVKNGLLRGKQRCRCKACGLNFTDTPPRGMPLRVKVTAVLLHLSGLSMDRTAKLLGVSTPSVQAWIERFAEVYAQKPETEGRAVVVEPDEMWHFLKKKSNKLWLWKARDRATGRLIDWELGGRDKATLERMLERLKRWRGRFYCAGGWEAGACPPAAYGRPGGRADPARAAVRRQGGDPRHRARPFPPAALAGPVPPPHLRGLQGRAHGRGLDRALRPLRGRPRDRRAPIYASLRPSLSFLLPSLHWRDLWLAVLGKQ